MASRAQCLVIRGKLQTKDIPSEVIEQEIEEAIKEVQKNKRHAKSNF